MFLRRRMAEKRKFIFFEIWALCGFFMGMGIGIMFAHEYGLSKWFGYTILLPSIGGLGLGTWILMRYYNVKNQEAASERYMTEDQSNEVE
jgi:F0F1-type ATP synthase assembly protein I